MLKKDSKYVSFEDNLLLTSLFGEQDSHLLKIEESLNIELNCRGNVVFHKWR